MNKTIKQLEQRLDILKLKYENGLPMTQDEQIDWDHYNETMIRRNLISAQIKLGIKLSVDDEYFYCNGIIFDALRDCAACSDEYFKRLFLEKRFVIPKDHKKAEPSDLISFEKMIDDWGVLVNITNHLDPLIHHIAKETRVELRDILKQFSGATVKAKKNIEKKIRRQLEWSRYRYVMIKKIFSLVIKSEYYLLRLNGAEIFFDIYSLSHILTRHYGYIMKDYITAKSHFDETFGYDTLHLQLGEIFRQIEESGYYHGQSIESVSFKYKGVIYRVYCDYATINKQGQPNVQRINVKTFFPVEEKGMLFDLEHNYQIKPINADLEVYVALSV